MAIVMIELYFSIKPTLYNNSRFTAVLVTNRLVSLYSLYSQYYSSRIKKLSHVLYGRVMKQVCQEVGAQRVHHLPKMKAKQPLEVVQRAWRLICPSFFSASPLVNVLEEEEYVDFATLGISTEYCSAVGQPRVCYHHVLKNSSH